MAILFYGHVYGHTHIIEHSLLFARYGEISMLTLFALGLILLAVSHQTPIKKNKKKKEPKTEEEK